MSSESPERSTLRQRATIACRFCRQRKRRCNGQRPVCSNCQAANVECIYQDVEQRRFDVEASLSSFGDRLDFLESRLLEHQNTLEHMRSLMDMSTSTPVAFFPRNSNNQLSQPESDPPQRESDLLANFGQRLEQLESKLQASGDALGQTPSFSVPTPGQSLNETATLSSNRSALTIMGTPTSALIDPTSSEVALPPMNIPLYHSTTTGSLISCPQVKSLLGDYPSDVFLRIEERRIQSPILKTPSMSNNLIEIPVLDPTVAEKKIEYFFESVNLQHPILDKDEIWTHLRQIMCQTLQPSLESALILALLALAEAASSQPENATGEWPPGTTYFRPALSISLDAYFNTSTTSINIPRCLYLAALYYSYLAQPLDSWRLVHLASTSLQRLWIRKGSTRPLSESRETFEQPLIKLSWGIFLLECDLIAEHHLPRSGIENVVEKLNLPICGDLPSPSLLAWLAELSSRLLLNRVHHAMYAEDMELLLKADYRPTNTSGGEEATISRLMSSSLKVSMELDEQLKTWYDMIPQTIKPDLNVIPASMRDAIILLRFHSARDIIFRPFLLFACKLPASISLPQHLLDICLAVIHSCRRYVEIAQMRLHEPSASTEIVIHSVFASMVILTIAAHSPKLRDYVQDIEELQTTAISTLQHWAFPGSCIEAMAGMLGAIQNKTKISQTTAVHDGAFLDMS